MLQHSDPKQTQHSPSTCNAFLTVIWGFVGSFGLPSFSLPPLDLFLLPPLAFLGKPMLGRAHL